MARLLITGASGFLGSNLLPLVTAESCDYEIHAISSKRDTDYPGVLWHQVDLTAPDEVKALMDEVKPEVLIHLAWFNGESASRYEDERNHLWVEITEGVVEAFAKAGGKRAVVTGSIIEYGPQDGPIPETATPTPTSTYGRCKVEATNRVIALGEKYDSLSTCIARPTFLLGPHEETARLVPTVATQLLRGEPAELSSGTQRRDYIHAADVASALVALVDSDVTGPVNVGRGESISVRELAELIAGEIGREDLLWFGKRAAGGDAGDDLVADISLITSKTDWKPAYDMASAVSQIVEWWKEQLAAETAAEQDAK